MDNDAFGFGELAYDDNLLPYQEDNPNIENNYFEENIPPKGKNKHKKSKKALTNKKIPNSLKILENRKKLDEEFCDFDKYNEQSESIFTSKSPLGLLKILIF